MKLWRFPFLLSGGLLILQAFPSLSPVRAPDTLLPIPGFHLEFPFWHLFFTPFSSIADSLTVFSGYELIAFGGMSILAVILLNKSWKSRFVMFLGLVLYMCWVGLAPRPMARLVAEDPEDLLIDFHSHTNISHDGRPSFSWEKNIAWHQNQGYSAGFITDHNRTEAAIAAKAYSQRHWRTMGYRALVGEEMSLHNAHFVVLGMEETIDNKPWDNDPAKIKPFIEEMRRRGFPVIASLPEYWKHYWGDGFRQFISWGIKGAEIISSAPKALNFPQEGRLEVYGLARAHQLFLTGISDSHGYGSATAAWNVMRIPGWRSMDPDQLENAVISELLSKGFNAVRVLERERTLWRGLHPWQVVSWMSWIWIFWLFRYGKN